MEALLAIGEMGLIVILAIIGFCCFIVYLEHKENMARLQQYNIKEEEDDDE